MLLFPEVREDSISASCCSKKCRTFATSAACVSTWPVEHEATSCRSLTLEYASVKTLTSSCSEWWSAGNRPAVRAAKLLTSAATAVISVTMVLWKTSSGNVASLMMCSGGRASALSRDITIGGFLTSSFIIAANSYRRDIASIASRTETRICVAMKLLRGTVPPPRRLMIDDRCCGCFSASAPAIPLTLFCSATTDRSRLIPLSLGDPGLLGLNGISSMMSDVDLFKFGLLCSNLSDLSADSAFEALEPAGAPGATT